MNLMVYVFCGEIGVDEVMLLIILFFYLVGYYM